MTGLYLADLAQGFMSLVGIISLVGLVVNNAILWLEEVDFEHLREGRDPFIIAAQRRFRPIFMTSISAIGGLLPLYFLGGSLWKPMAISLIFGLIFSTFAISFLLPVLGSLIFRHKPDEANK